MSQYLQILIFLLIIKTFSKSMACIFMSSKYYQQTKLSPLEIAPPLGYDFLNKTKQNFDMPNAGQLILRQVFDKPHVRVLSQKKTPTDRIQQYLKISQNARKNQYLAPTFTDYMRNQLNKQIFLTLQKQFVPHSKPQYSVVELSQLLRNPRIQSITHIEDYGLSKFIFACQGSDPWRMQYLYQFFNRRIIQYPVECEVINHNHLKPQQFLLKQNCNTIIEPPTQIEDVECVKNFINNFNQLNKKKDPLYTGVHFYFADFSKKTLTADYFQRQIMHYPLLQYYLTVLTGILGDGQTAVLKLCGAFKHKTFEFIFLLKLIFNGKVSLCKTLGSNPFLPDSYIVCEYYNKTNGDIVHKYLLQNYHLLQKFSDQKLLLDPKKILKQDLHSNVKNFNEALIHRGFQTFLKQFKSNSNIEYYPPKQKILEKLPNYAPDISGIVRQMIKLSDKQSKQTHQTEKIVKNQEKIKAEPPRPSILTGGLFAKKKPNPAPAPAPQSNDKK